MCPYCACLKRGLRNPAKTLLTGKLDIRPSWSIRLENFDQPHSVQSLATNYLDGNSGTWYYPFKHCINAFVCKKVAENETRIVDN